MFQPSIDPVEHSATGKYLTLDLDNEHYGIPILAVREIIAVQPITPLPRMPRSVRGVINLRGKIIPVVDLRVALGLNAADEDRSTCIVVLELNAGEQTPMSVGCIVDSVREVQDIASEDLQEPPRLGDGERVEAILALAKSEGDDHVVSLLAMDCVLAEVFGALQHSSALPEIEPAA